MIAMMSLMIRLGKISMLRLTSAMVCARVLAETGDQVLAQPVDFDLRGVLARSAAPSSATGRPQASCTR